MKHVGRWPAPRSIQQEELQQTLEPLEDFSDTISADIESTRSQYVKLNLLQGGSRAERELDALRQRIIDAQTTELKELRHQVAALTATMATKASKAKQDSFANALTAKIDKRLDTIRNLILAAIAIIGLIMGWVAKTKG